MPVIPVPGTSARAVIPANSGIHPSSHQPCRGVTCGRPALFSGPRPHVRHSRAGRPLQKSSFPRKREGGLTYEGQPVLPAPFRRGPVVQTLAGGSIVHRHQLRKAGGRPGCPGGLAGPPAAPAPAGLFAAAFLPGRGRGPAAGCAPAGLARARGAMVAGAGLAPGGGPGPPPPGAGRGPRGRRCAWEPAGEPPARGALMHGQPGWSSAAAAPQSGGPRARGRAGSGGSRPLVLGTLAVDERGGTATPVAPPAPVPRGPWPVVAPGAGRFRARGLGGDAAVARLLGAARRAPFPPEPASDLRRRPALVGLV